MPPHAPDEPAPNAPTGVLPIAPPVKPASLAAPANNNKHAAAAPLAQQGLGGDAPPQTTPPASSRRPPGIPLEVYNHETTWQRIGYLGPTLVGALSIALTIVVWHYGYTINRTQLDLQKQQTEIQKQQTEIQDRQAKIAEEQKRLAFADMRARLFKDFAETDETKRTAAILGLVDYGPDALPLLKMALGTDSALIRETAVDALIKMFQLGTVERAEVMRTSLNYLSSTNPYLRMSVLRCFARMGSQLDEAEAQQVVKFIEANITPDKSCANAEDKEVILAAAQFLSTGPPTAQTQLLKIAHYPQCGGAWAQAIEFLPKIAEKLPPPEQAAVASNLEQIRDTVLQHLRQTVSDDELRLKSSTYKQYQQEITSAYNDAIDAIKQP
jgi:hypothetical protein